MDAVEPTSVAIGIGIGFVISLVLNKSKDLVNLAIEKSSAKVTLHPQVPTAN